MTVLPQNYLRTLDSIRDRCGQVYEKGQKDQLDFFDVDDSKLPQIVDHVASLTQRRFPDLSKIPPHSRLRHFGINDGLDRLQNIRETRWKKLDKIESARRLIDLVIASVLVDAGAGQTWKYKAKDGELIGRSEGLAVASFDMFEEGYFSSSKEVPDRVDVEGLAQLSIERMTQGFQVTSANTMVGLEGRSNLLKGLSKVLEQQKKFFPTVDGQPRRPGNLVDYLLANVEEDDNGKKSVSIEKLWEVIMSLADVWPARVTIEGVKLGDVWPCSCLEDKGNYENLVPFHKLSQWLTYSLVEAIESSIDLTIKGTEKMTGLPEYRNGGLLVDYGLLKLKPAQVKRGTSEGQELPTFEGSDSLIVEWRALTVIYLDKIHKAVEKKLGQDLVLAQVLEGGTWTAGREIAATLRPDTAGPPIVMESDGTLF
ncbi:hypothetical protein J3Q64DRAFT_1329773 [Phycomyces blakesleeanus]|uniref:DUF1688-domain-containing protein n=2 Tax=Phycomyces blakesleeanus TaxID=4837 RepID=A0A163EPP6_PHYB8|nr:hypothetical protein PHYBLDRAFT_176535 [Phycomyces blakesleeanus NRRL 1555(-)]OAD80680.1 hypothetical protein PHYBLDRAFT_176535 [Phycomyces blakesleeanus NRRL 1555(-)]|eukprot:XP_018298720.1 hypothetical protein PHYBLDRAFT_176535 [Phycomyces blakesleeanus NRRL 1555(-)]